MALRKPNSRYSGRNGFDEENRRYTAENLPQAEAVDAMDLGCFVMREMGSFFPSFEEMKRMAEAPDNLDTVNERIRKLKTDHADSLAKLGNYFVQTVAEEALDRYYQTEELKYQENLPEDDVKHCNELEKFFKQSKSTLRSEFVNVESQMKYDFLQELIPLEKRRRELEAMDPRRVPTAPGAVRRVTSTPFPPGAAAYRVLDREAQLLVAKFLMADAPKREEMRSRLNWAKPLTEPLIAQFNDNVEFRQEVEVLVRRFGTRDPRVRVRA